MARIDKDTEITVVNNTHGAFVYFFKDISLELDEYGDEDTLTFGELKTISSGRHKKVLQNLLLLITDVNDDELTVDDVVKQLKLDRYYAPVKEAINEEDDISSDSFKTFVEKSTAEELKKALSIDNLKPALIEVSVELYKDKNFNDFDKRKAIGDSIGLEDFNEFFSDIKVS